LTGAVAEIGLELARLSESILDGVPLSLQGEVRSAAHIACAGAMAAADLVVIDIACAQPRSARRPPRPHRT
jgi:hypothetical protein